MSALKERIIEYIEILPDNKLVTLEPLLRLLTEEQAVGDPVTPVSDSDRKSPRKSIEERFKGYSGDYKPTEIDWGAPVGKEIW